MKGILVKLNALDTIKHVEHEQKCDKEKRAKPVPRDIIRLLTWTEKAKIHLARALVMNPEIMVADRPLSHYDEHEGDRILRIISEHVSGRGIEMPAASAGRRRPRTVFFSAETFDQEAQAHVIWNICSQSKGVKMTDNTNGQYSQIEDNFGRQIS